MLLLVESGRNQIVIPVSLVWTFGNEISITFTIVTSKFSQIRFWNWLSTSDCSLLPDLRWLNSESSTIIGSTVKMTGDVLEHKYVVTIVYGAFGAIHTDLDLSALNFFAQPLTIGWEYTVLSWFETNTITFIASSCLSRWSFTFTFNGTCSWTWFGSIATGCTAYRVSAPLRPFSSWWWLSSSWSRISRINVTIGIFRFCFWIKIYETRTALGLMLIGTSIWRPVTVALCGFLDADTVMDILDLGVKLASNKNSVFPAIF